MAHTRITNEAKQRMKMVMAWRDDGKTLAEIGWKLKVTKERVRQIEKLGRHLYER
jgi:DNA-directed RNA polymerase sigma subunit (sigma70/sigma32)